MEGVGPAAGERVPQGSSSRVSLPAAGTPIGVQHKEILKPKVVQPVVAKAAVKSGNDYAWDEPEGSGGWSGWVSEKLVSLIFPFLFLGLGLFECVLT